MKMLVSWGLLYVCLISFSAQSQNSYQNPYSVNPIEAIIATGFKSYQDNPIKGFEKAVSIWNLKVDILDELKATELSRGNYVGFETLWWETLSDYNCIACVSVNYQSGPLFLLFHGFKSNNYWDIFQLTILKDVREVLAFNKQNVAVGSSKVDLGSARTAAFQSQELSRTLKSLQFEIVKLGKTIESLKREDTTVVKVDSVKTKKPEAKK